MAFGQGTYILGGPDGHTPIEVDNILEWADWFENAERHVGETKIKGLYVSTVFLGLDHNFSGGRPILFETMIFKKGVALEYQERYSTWEEAERGHARAVIVAKNMTTTLLSQFIDYVDRFLTIFLGD